MDRRGQPVGVREGFLRGALSPQATQRQMDVLAAYVAVGGSVPGAADLVGIQPSTVKRHLADLRARSGLTTEQLIYAGRASGRLIVPSLESLEPAAVKSRHRAKRVSRSRRHGLCLDVFDQGSSG